MDNSHHDSPQKQLRQQDADTNDDWEEWDGRSPFLIHCVAGSFAGVSEHALVYPLDTVRTHIQVCAACLHKGKNNAAGASFLHAKNSALLRSSLKAGSNNAASTGSAAASAKQLPIGMWQTIRYLVNEPIAATTTASAKLTLEPKPNTVATMLQGWSRLWMGVHTILIGCIPAHALYFSSYESVKAATATHTRDAATGIVTTHISPFGSSLAGAAAAFSHDVIMTPLDTMKQRIQLGHYNGSVRTAFRSILAEEGWMALYRSLPVTLATNIPYGMVMVSTHEFCKQALAGQDAPTWQTVMAASSMGGCVAAAVTTPLDRIKTALQTQQLAPACRMMAGGGGGEKCRKKLVAIPQHATWGQAARSIFRNEGFVGFFRGLCPRLLSHTPAVAISWTTYETTRNYLLQQYASSSSS